MTKTAKLTTRLTVKKRASLNTSLEILLRVFTISNTHPQQNPALQSRPQVNIDSHKIKCTRNKWILEESKVDLINLNKERTATRQ